VSAPASGSATAAAGAVSATRPAGARPLAKGVAQ
jgi:hypothetical protein